MRSFDETLELMRIELEQSEGALILVSICDDTALRDHTIKELRQRLSPHISLRDFHYDPEHLSLLEAAVENLQSGNGRLALSVTGLEELPHDKWSEAIKLLNLQRNRFGYTGATVILWVNRTTHAEIANKSADFFSWRSGTFIIEPPPGWNTLESTRRSYLHALIAQNEFVNLQGLAPRRGSHIMQMRMEEIFIPLQAEQEVRIAEVVFPGGEKVKEVEVSEETEGEPELRPGALKQRMGRSNQPEVKTRHVEIPEVLQERHAVILGDPGAGKTTLLRYLAYRLAREQTATAKDKSVDIPAELLDCLPVYVRIGEYAQHLQHHPEATLDSFALLSSQAQQLPLTDELLADALRQGRVIFLFDGLDEIIDTSQRRHIALRVEEFARAQPQCRIIVTSRIVGYREARLQEEFTQFTIRFLAENEIRRFAESWYASLGQPHNARALIEAIENNPSVRRLATNPLLLTIIALIHWRGAKLPQHRAKLYNEAAETLVDQWMSQRRVNPEGWDAHETLHLLLPTIAWRLHSTTASGLIGEQELHALLVETLRQQDSHLSESEAHARALQFRRNVSEFSGIFLERGLDPEGRGLYGFLHLTFEEYFAAIFLTDAWEREGKKALQSLLHRPRWTEVILLTAGCLSDASQFRTTKFVKEILSARSEYENILHRDFLLAAKCLADEVRIDLQDRYSIVKKLLALYFDLRSPKALLEDIKDVLGRFHDTDAERDIRGELSSRLSSSVSGTRVLAMEALGHIGVKTPEILSALVECLNDPDWSVISAVANTLEQLGEAAATPHVVAKLLQILMGPVGATLHWVIENIFQSFGTAAAIDEAILMLSNILMDRRVRVRMSAATIVGWLGPRAATPKILCGLSPLLSNPNEYARRAGARALGKLGLETLSPNMFSALFNLLGDSQIYVRKIAAEAIGQLGRESNSQEILFSLGKLLVSLKWEVRRSALEVIENWGQSINTARVFPALKKSLTDSEASVREAAIVALTKLGLIADDPEVFSSLISLLSDHKEAVREAAAKAIGQVGRLEKTEEVLSELPQLFADGKSRTRIAAMRVVQEMGSIAATPTVRSALFDLLADHRITVCEAALLTIKKLGPIALTPEILSRLLTLLNAPKWLLRFRAALALEELGRDVTTPEVITSLYRLLSSPKEEEYVRGAAAAALGSLGTAAATPEIFSILLNILMDPNRDSSWDEEKALVKFSKNVSAQDHQKVVELILPLTRSNKHHQQNIGYVCLRNLLAGEQESTVEA